MTTTPPPLDFQHLPGYEIPTKYKEAIRQLHWFGHVPVSIIQVRYHLGENSVRRILSYDYPERRRPNRKGPAFLLSDQEVDDIIEYVSDSWEYRIIKYDVRYTELGLQYSMQTLERRLKQRGYFRCTACQKPFLTKAQVIARYLWAMAYIFWYTEWLKVLWSDEVTFLIGGRAIKEKVTRKRGERTCETCI
jgi:hypothetical protein